MDDNQKIRIIKVCTISAVIFMLLLLSALIINLVTLAQSNSEQKKLEAELNRLNGIIASNSQEIDYKSTDEYIEKYMRDYQNAKRKGDIVFSEKKNNED